MMCLNEQHKKGLHTVRLLLDIPSPHNLIFVHLQPIANIIIQLFVINK